MIELIPQDIMPASVPKARSRALPAILIFAGVLLIAFSIGAWNWFRPGLPASLFSTLIGTPASGERIVIAVSPSTVEDGESFYLAWLHENATGREGRYELSFPCRDEVSLWKATSVFLPCGEALPVLPDETLEFIPTLAGETPTDVSLTIRFISDDGEEAILSETATITLVPAVEKTIVESAPANETESVPVVLQPGTPQTTVYRNESGIISAGASDLAISIVTFGVINEATGVVTATTTVRREERAGMVFEVTNIGGASSERWMFSARLPTAGGGDFKSEMQPSLNPGEKIRFTIGFGPLERTGENEAILTLDPQNSIRDVNRANDSLRVVFLSP